MTIRVALFALLIFTASCAMTKKVVGPISAKYNHPVILKSDGVSDPYTQIENAFVPVPETPDCSHESFGPHITQAMDPELRHSVFIFHLHVKPDNDRCIKFDRQRTEIKMMGDQRTPDYLKGLNGDKVSFRWKFKLPKGFQASFSFTHLHQLKAYDGDKDMPLVTLTARKGEPDTFQIIQIDSEGNKVLLSSNTLLEGFVGEWVEAYERVTYGHNGSYELLIKRVSDQKILLNYLNPHLDLWRKGASVVRPKWGIYRSLEHPEQLRDEDVSFDEFCAAKTPDDC